MDPAFRVWASQRLSENSLNSYLSGLRSLESAYGDLNALHDADGFAELLSELSYTSADERQGRPNPSRVPIRANLSRQLSNLRSHLKLYAAFLEGDLDTSESIAADPIPEGKSDCTLSLETDLQAALRSNIAQLESGLEITDGGTEKRVPSGFIDILARDSQGTAVVIELKAVTARRETLGQIAAYMADIDGEARARDTDSPGL